MATQTKRALVVYSGSWRTRIRAFRDAIRAEYPDWKFDFWTEQQYASERLDRDRYNVIVMQSTDDLRADVVAALKKSGDPAPEPKPRPKPRARRARKPRVTGSVDADNGQADGDN